MAETTRQRQAFDRYWELGSGRSIERLADELDQRGKAPSLRTLYEWSSRYHWQQRLGDLERDARSIQEEARLTALREMYERQSREALLLQQKGTEWLTQLGVDGVSAEAAIRAIIEGAKLERLARGEPGDRQEFGATNDGDDRFAGFSDDELRALAAAAERIVDSTGEARPD